MLGTNYAYFLCMMKFFNEQFQNWLLFFFQNKKPLLLSYTTVKSKDVYDSIGIKIDVHALDYPLFLAYCVI